LGVDAVQVVHLAFEPTSGKRQPGQAGHGGPAWVDGQVHFHPPVRGGGDVQVDGAQHVPVVVRGDQGQPEALALQGVGVLDQIGGGRGDGDAVVAGRPAAGDR
jgi:hypothetical protein